MLGTAQIPFGWYQGIPYMRCCSEPFWLGLGVTLPWALPMPFQLRLGGPPHTRRCPDLFWFGLGLPLCQAMPRALRSETIPGATQGPLDWNLRAPLCQELPRALEASTGPPHPPVCSMFRGPYMPSMLRALAVKGCAPPSPCTTHCPVPWILIGGLHLASWSPQHFRL